MGSYGTFFACAALHGFHRTREHLSYNVRKANCQLPHKNVHIGINKKKKKGGVRKKDLLRDLIIVIEEFKLSVKSILLKIKK